MSRMDARPEAVAIVGMGCRFPGADGIHQFWRMLQSGAEAITPAPPARQAQVRALFPDSWPEDELASDVGGFVEDIERFDFGFFDIPEDEARHMDPQQRLLLETAWMAMEHAGHLPSRLRDSDTGVFVGIGGHDFSVLLWPTCRSAHASTGASVAIAANRISYCFGLRGPSMTIDSACSSSLTAVHTAVRSIVHGECDVALAGGASALLLPQITASLSRAGRISPDGRCRSFGEGANGFVRGEGAGMIVLKRYSAARRDGDRILALVAASGVNHNGRSNGLSAPSPTAQAELMRGALAESGICADSIGYVEASATGTQLGDAIEMKALKDGLVEGRSSNAAPLVVGSVKGNIGHLEAAGGIAGLIKVVLSLTHGIIPRSLHSERLNPMCQVDGSRITVAQSPSPWRAEDSGRYACVNSFGFGGANAHVVLRGHPPEPTQSTGSNRACLLPVSAKSPHALERLLERYRDWCRAHPDELIDVCATAARRRMHWRFRAAVEFCGSTGIDAAFAAAERGSTTTERPTRDLVLRGNMHTHGRRLLRILWEVPGFRRTVAEADHALAGRLVAPMRALWQSGALEVEEAWFPVALDYCVGRWLVQLLPGRGGYFATGFGEVAALLLWLDLPLARLDGLLSGSDAIEAIAATKAPGVRHLHFFGPRSAHGPPRKEATPAKTPSKTVLIELAAGGGEQLPGVERALACFDCSEANSLNHLMRQLYVAGTDIDWSVIYADGGYRHVSLPDYPFDKEWVWPWNPSLKEG